MSEQMEVVFQGIARSEATAAYAEERYQHLKERFPRISSGRLTVKLPHRHSQKGAAYELHLELHVARGSAVNVTNAGEPHDDLGLAPVVNDAFKAAATQLEHQIGRRERVA